MLSNTVRRPIHSVSGCCFNARTDGIHIHGTTRAKKSASTRAGVKVGAKATTKTSVSTRFDRRWTSTTTSTSNKKKATTFFVPVTQRQKEYRDVLCAADPSIVVVTGPAGTAKTFGAVMVAIEKLRAGAVERIVLTRPAVGADEDLGFLPGDLEDKMRAWLLPVVDALRVYMSHEEVSRLFADGGGIEICSLTHMRGRTLRNAFVVVDECQNTTPSQMLMCLTRIGEGSKFVFTGDPAQHDRPPGHKGGSGLVDFIERYDSYESDVTSDSDSESDDDTKAEGDAVDTEYDVIPADLFPIAAKLFPIPQRRPLLHPPLPRHVHLFSFGSHDVQRHAAIPTILEMYGK